MYSGSDSTDSVQNPKWPPFNPMYPNQGIGHIDWGALAQQWIIMKEAGPPVPELTPPSPPPPPNINHRSDKKDNLSEGGEAPMEVENDKEEGGPTQWNDAPTSDGSWSWNQQQQWGYSWSPSMQANINSKTALLPTPGGYNQYSTAQPDVSTSFAYNTKPAATDYAGGYWTTNSSKSKPHNKRFSKVNVPQKSSSSATASTTLADLGLDSNKRKQLPAWIRDGLEKMERDKLKQMEKEKDKNEPIIEETKPTFNQKEALEIIKSTVKQRERSKFDSDGEDSSNDVKSRFKSQSVPEPIMISHEEMMLRIRKSMTEILLKVTNQEILAVCKEEMQRSLRKRKASDRHVSASSGNNLSAKLGVGMYGDSESSADESGTSSDQEAGDSDAALKATIKRRKAEFVKTEKEIEDRLAAAENPADDGDRAGTPDIHQSQVDSKFQDYRVKLGNSATTLKNTAGKGSSSVSSVSDSDMSEKGHNKVLSRRSSDSSQNQRYIREYAKRNDATDSDRKSKNRYSDSQRSRRSRSKSNSSRRNRSPSRDRHYDYRRSRSRSSSKSYRSNDSYSKSSRSRKSRSHSRSRHHNSISSERSSRYKRNSHTRRKSKSGSPEDYYRRSRSPSSSRSKRSRRR